MKACLGRRKIIYCPVSLLLCKTSHERLIIKISRIVEFSNNRGVGSIIEIEILPDTNDSWEKQLLQYGTMPKIWLLL